MTDNVIGGSVFRTGDAARDEATFERLRVEAEEIVDGDRDGDGTPEDDADGNFSSVGNDGGGTLASDPAIVRLADLPAGDGDVANADAASNDAYVDFSGGSTGSGEFVEFTVVVPAAGAYDLSVGYALSTDGAGNDRSRDMNLSVNGATWDRLFDLSSTGAEFDDYGESTTRVTLREGANTIRLASNGGSGPNIDYLEVHPLSDDLVVFQGEALANTDTTGGNKAVDAARAEADGETFRVGAEGAAYLDWAGAGANADMPVTASAAGTFAVSVTYANGSNAARPLELVAIRGGEEVVLGTFGFAPTPAPSHYPDDTDPLAAAILPPETQRPSGWEGWTTETLSVDLLAGDTVLRLRTPDGANTGPNIDKVEVRLLAVAGGPPVALTLDNAEVVENAAGATVGTLAVEDPDGDEPTYTVDDDRFEVVNGTLKLAGGISLDHETEPTVTVTVTATDDDGSIARTFEIAVLNDAADDPVPGTAVLFDADAPAGDAGSIVGYAGLQDRPHAGGETLVVSDDGSALTLNNNQWKRVALPENYTITADTRLVLDVAIGATVPEVVAVGYDGDENPFDGEPRIFQLDGTDRLAPFEELRGTGTDNGDGTRRYVIELGRDAGQAIDSLIFIADDDMTGDGIGSATFANVRLLEGDPGTGTPTNRAPAATGDPVAPIEATLGENVEGLPLADYAALFTDPDGDDLALSVENLPAGLELNTEGVIVGAPTAAGDFVATLRATDPSGASATVALPFRIGTGEAVNAAPAFDSADPVALTLAEGDPLPAIDAAATDADGDALAYSLAGNDAAAFTIDAQTGAVAFADPLPAPADGTSYAFEIVVSDGTAEARKDVTVTVEAATNAPPTFDSPDALSLTVTEGDPLPAIDTGASDPDNDDLTFALAGPDAAAFTLDGGAIAFADPLPAPANGTAYEFAVTVSDGAETASRSITVTVEPAGTGGEPIIIQAEDDARVAVTDLGAPNATGSNVTREVNEANPDAFGNFRVGAEGDAYIDFGTEAGDAIAFSVDAEEAGTYTATIRYANGSNQTRPLELSVNGGPATNVDFVPTQAPTAELSGWEGWTEIEVEVELQAGANAVSLAIPTAANGGVANGPNIDRITFTPPADDGTGGEAIEVPAGAFTITDADGDTSVRSAANPEGNADDTNSGPGLTYTADGIWPGATDGEYLDLGGDAGDTVGFQATVEEAGTYALTLRYANGGGNGADRPMDLTVNGAAADTIAFGSTIPAGEPASAGWSNWTDVTVEIELQAGANQIALANVGNAGPNIDRATLAPVTATENTAPIFTSTEAITLTVAEGDPLPAIDAAASDADGDALAYSLAGSDTAAFTIDAQTGAIAFADPLPAPADGTSYAFEIVVSDGTAEARKDVTVTVEAAVEAFSETIPAETFAVTDADGDTVVRSPDNPEGGANGTNSGPGLAYNADGIRPGANGNAYLDMGGEAGDAASFSVTVPEAGEYDLAIRYANGGATDRPMVLEIGGTTQTVSFPSTATDAPDQGWGNWQTVTVPVTLQAGENAITLSNVGNAGPNLDEVTISREGTDGGGDPVVEPGPRETIRINFQDGAVSKVQGYIAGEFVGYGTRNGQTYGFVTESSAIDPNRGEDDAATPIDGADYPAVAINERTTAGVDPRLQGYAHFDLRTSYPAGEGNRVAWELALPDGTYEVTVSVGDTGGPNDSQNRLFIEGEEATAWTPTDLFKSQLVTRTVEVTDGELTLSAQGGTVTEMQYVEVRALPDLTPDDARAAEEDYARFVEAIAVARTGDQATEVALDPGIGVRPEGVDPASDIILGIEVVEGRGGVLLDSLSDGSIRLYETLTGEEVAFDANTTGGFDAVTISPTGLLKDNTSYTLDIDGFRDRGPIANDGAATREFQRYTTTFVTGEAAEVEAREVAFAETIEVDGFADGGIAMTSVELSPDGSKLYASSITGTITRWDRAADGSLSNAQVLRLDYFNANAPQDATGADAARGIIGLTFDPTDANTLWVTDNYQIPLNGRDNGVPDFSGRVTKLTLGTGDAFTATAETYITGLPRSNGDHVTNSLEFRANPDAATPGEPSHLLYLIQGSNSAMGEADSAWGLRPERLLNASVMEIDPTRTPPPGGFDVATEPLPADGQNRRFADPDGDLKNGPIPITSGEFDGNFLVFAANGTATVEDADGNVIEAFYDPFADDAVLRIFATGQRNAYDLVWHSNGFLYVPTNGSAAGGNTPDDPDTAADEGLFNVVKQDDYLFRVEEGGYYGHPNPLRDEFVMNGGNPTAGADPNEVAPEGNRVGYQPGQQPDPNYDLAGSYSLGANRSPNGATEYTGAAFGASLQNALIFTEYSGGNDLRAVLFNADGTVREDFVLRNTNGEVIEYVDPLDVIEDPNTGQLYVLTLNRGTGASQIVRLDPAPGGVVDGGGGGGDGGEGEQPTLDGLVGFATIQAETGTVGGTTAVRDQANPEPNGTVRPGGTGPLGGYVDFGTTADDFVEWTVEVAEEDAGPVTLALRYANGGAADRPLDVVIDGTTEGTVPFETTTPPGGTTDDGFDTWEIALFETNLAAGQHTIRLEVPAGATPTGPNIDRLDLYKPESANAPDERGIVIGGLPFDAWEAENAELDGAQIVLSTEDPRNAEGTGFVDYVGPGDESVTFTIEVDEAGTYEVALRYALAASKGSRPLDLSVNGTAAGSLPFVGQSNEAESTWSLERTTLDLQAGANTITLTAPGGVGPNLDRLLVSQIPVTPADPEVVATAVGLDPAFFADRLHFSHIDDPSLEGEADRQFKSTGTVRIANEGAGTLEIASWTLDGPFALVDPAALDDVALGAGESLDVAVAFDRAAFTARPDNQSGVFEGALTLLTNDAANRRLTVDLAGFWQPVDEGGREPNVNEVWQVFGFGNRIEGLSLVGGGQNSALSTNDVYAQTDETEVLSPYWRIADGATEATFTQLAAFHGPGGAPFGIHGPGDKSGGNDIQLWNHSGVDNQTVLPNVGGPDSTAFATATITRDDIPGGWDGEGLFGMEVAGLSTDPTLNPTGDVIVEGEQQGHTVKVFRALDAEGNTIPDTYLVIMDYTGINYDYNDNMFVVTGIEPAIPSLEVATPPGGVPDRLTMSRIDNPAGRGVSDTATMTLSNDGVGELDVTAIEVADPTLFAILDENGAEVPSLPAFTLAGGESRDVTVRYLGTDPANDDAAVLDESSLAIRTGDGQERTIALAGLAQIEPEGGEEPTVQQIVDAFGYTTDVAQAQLNADGLVEANGDEILAPYFVSADGGPVTITELAVYQRAGDVAEVAIHDPDSRDLTVLLSNEASDTQTVLPDGPDGTLATVTFDRTDPFGIRVGVPTRDGFFSWSDPNINVYEDQIGALGDGNVGYEAGEGHLIRTYVARDANGAVIPDTYIVVQDYAGVNYDYNDVVMLLQNVRPYDPTGNEDADGDGIIDGYQTDSDGDGTPDIADPDDDTGGGGGGTIDPPAGTFTLGVNFGGGAIASDPVLGVPLVAQSDPRVTLSGTVNPGAGVDAASNPNGANATPGSAFQTYEDGSDWTATIAVPDGVYNVALHTQETYWASAGQRQFDASVNGVQVIDDLDPFAQAGGDAPITVVTEVEVRDGQIVIDLDATGPDGIDNAPLNAVTIFRLGDLPGTGGGDGQSPFGGTAPAFTDGALTVDATDFDEGGQGVAYSDDPGLDGGNATVRPDRDVEYVGSELDIGYVEPGEWVEYTIEVPEAGTYDLSAIAKTPVSDATIAVSIEGGPALATLQLADGGTSFADAPFQQTGTVPIDLPAGTQTLRLTFGGSRASNGYVLDLRSFTLTESGDGPVEQRPASPDGEPWSIGDGLEIDATLYDEGGQGVAYNDAAGLQGGTDGGRTGSDVEVTPGGDVGWIADGEWLEYTIDVPAAGEYALDFLMSLGNGATNRSVTASFEQGGQTYLTADPVPNQPAVRQWSAFERTDAATVTLQEGEQVLRLLFNGGSQDIRSLRLQPVAAAIEAIGESGTLQISQPDAGAWTTVTFAEPIQNPVVVTGPLTTNGGQPATVRVRNVTETGFEVQIDEWDYLDGFHLTETLSWMAVSAGVHTLSDGRTIAAGVDRGDGTPDPVDYGTTFDDAPVVLAQVVSTANAGAVTDRVSGVGTDGFTLRLQNEEANAAAPAEEDVAWIAIAGGGSAASGDLVGSTGDRVTHQNASVAWDGAFAAQYALLADMQSFDGGDPATVRTRSRGTSGATFYLAEEKSADAETSHTTENVGYAAFTVGVLEGTRLS